MIALLLALTLQTVPAEADKAVPTLTAADPCVELQGRGVAMIGDRRLRGRTLARAVAEGIPPGRPLFIRFANERASSDFEGMSAVMAGAINAPEIVIVQTCELPAVDIAQ